MIAAKPGLPHLRTLLEGRDLGQVEGVADVDAVAGEVDGREVIHGEVAERMRRRSTGEHGCAEDPEQPDEDEGAVSLECLSRDGSPEDREVRD